MEVLSAAVLCTLLAAAPAQESPGGREIDGLVERLNESPDGELGAVLREAFDRFMREAEELHLVEAEALARAMHGRARAQWSALSFALISSRMGKPDQADRILAEQDARATSEAERVELIERRAIAAAGAGRRELALDLLNRALERGGRDAGQMLGRDALARGDYPEARRLFRPLLPPVEAGRGPYERGEVPAWALRGWGLALLGP